MKRTLIAPLIICWAGVGWAAPSWLSSALIADPSDTPTFTPTATFTATPTQTKTFTPTVTYTPTNTPAWPEATPTPRPVLGSLTGITREIIEIDINDYVTIVSMRGVADASGTIEVPIGRIDGLLMVGIARPDPDLAPDDNYDIEIICERTGHDILGGAGANRSNSAASAFVPLPVAGSAQTAPGIGKCYLRATNVGAANGILLELEILGRASGPP